MKYIILIICFLTSLLSAYSQIVNRDSVYILIDRNNYQFKMDISKDSSRSSFSILKYRFRTKKLRNEYIKKIEKTFELQTDFYINFRSFKKPKKEQYNSISEFYSIEKMSKNNLNIGHSTKFFFVEKLDCSFYKVYETYLQFEE